MSGVVRFSEAFSLGLHAMVMLAKSDGRPLTAAQISQTLCASEAHLAKVMQRLVRCGLVSSVRGPRGGFTLARDADSVTLLEIFETIEGPLVTSDCLMDVPVCSGRRCLLGGLLHDLGSQVRQHLSTSTLATLAGEESTALPTRSSA